MSTDRARVDPRSGALLPTIVAVVAIAAVVRVLAGLDDFWLDEVWSWALAQRARSAWDILTELHHDNNHFLNTWIVWILGPDRHWVVYRVPAIVAGVGSVWLAGSVLRRVGPVERVTAMTLVATSYLCIHYSSEARGYSYAVFFALATWRLVDEALEGKPAWVVSLGFTATLGMLSHLTFYYFYASLVIWSAWHVWRSSRGWSRFLVCHAWPVAFGTALYLGSVHGGNVGGGTFVSAGAASLEAASLAIGGPQFGPLVVPCATVTVVVIVAGLALLARRGDDRWLFYALTIAVVPLAMVLAAPREDFYVRYFLIATVFFLLLAAQVLSAVLQLDRRGRIVFAGLLLAFLVANTVHTARLLRLGRGSYLEAISFLVASTPGNVSLAGTHDFRTFTVLRYYLRWIPDSDRLYYFRRDTSPAGGPDWILAHDFDPRATPPRERTDRAGNRYRLIREFRYAGLSGWNWYFYRNESRPLPSGPPR